MNESFIKKIDDNNDEGYIFEVDVEYPKQLYDSQNDLPSLSERMKIRKLGAICMIKKLMLET